MILDLLAKIIIVAVAGVVFVVSFRDTWLDLRRREREYDAFEFNRARRQAEFDRHAQAVAKAMLWQEAAKIHFVGEAWHD